MKVYEIGLYEKAVRDSMSWREKLECAKECGYEQAELEVVSKNERAVALYEKIGFERVGERPKAMKHKDGSYDSNIIMVKQL